MNESEQCTNGHNEIRKATIFGDGKGSCWAACLASILDLPIDAVPNFCGEPERNEGWLKDTDNWLRPMGLRIFMVQMPDNPSGVSFALFPGTPLIVNGKSPRGDFAHVVIMALNESEEWRIIHDPHPSGDGIRDKWLDVSVIVKA